MTCISERIEVAQPPAFRPEPCPQPMHPVVGTARRHALHRVLTVLAVAMVAVEISLLLPRLGAIGKAVTQVRWTWLLLALAGEAASMLVFALLQRRMLRAGGVHVPLRGMASASLAANALCMTLPAGSVLSTGYLFHRMRRFGATTAVATWGLFVAGVMGTITFAALGVLASTEARGGDAVALALAGVAVVTITLLAALTAALRRPQMLTRIASNALRPLNRLLGRDRAAGSEVARRVVDQVVSIRPSGFDWLLGLLFASLNWTGDLACLVFSCYAVGLGGMNLQLVLIAYVAGMASSGISLLPGGIGSIDAILIVTLVHGGIASPLAAAGVLIYRLISFVLLAGLGWLIWALIRDHTPPTIREKQCPQALLVPSRRAFSAEQR